MADGKRNAWKVFGMIVIIAAAAAAIAAAAFLAGRGCEEEDDKGTTTPTRTETTAPAPAPAEETPEGTGEAGEAVTEEGPAPTDTTATTERYIIGEGEGATLCVGGFQTVTRTTYYSDGSTDTVTTTEPCTP